MKNATNSQNFASGEWAHLFGPGLQETRCRIVIDLDQSKVIAAQEWTGLKFEDVRGDRLADISDSVINANNADENPIEFDLELSSQLPQWAARALSQAPHQAIDAQPNPGEGAVNAVESTSIPLTAAFMHLVDILQYSKQRFEAETALAEATEMPAPKDPQARCADLFYTEFAPQLKAAGLSLNDATLNSLLSLEFSEDVGMCEYDMLPEQFVFDLSLNQGKGGIKDIQEECALDRQRG